MNAVGRLALAAGVLLLVGTGCGAAGSTGAPSGSADDARQVGEPGAPDSEIASATPAVPGGEPAERATRVSPSTVPSTVPPTVPPTSSIAPAPISAPVTAPVVRSGASVSPSTVVGDPLRITIPAIGVDGVVVASGLLPDGTADVPEDPSIAGWYAGGPRPGEQGPAMIMGHVDSRRYGPGVFYRLVELTVGDEVSVETTTGPQHFVVRSVEQYPKDQFPTDHVYGSEPGATLRLVTCGGSFDESVRSYRDNIVAFLVRTA